MDINPLLLWIHWDPPRQAFTIPLIDRPIAWYGLLFSFGFFVAYFLIGYLIQKKLEEKHEIASRDISSWPKLIKLLQTAIIGNESKFKNVLYFFDSGLKNDIKKLNWSQEPKNDIKIKILNALTHYSSKHTRDELNCLFQNTIMSPKRLSSLLVDKLTWVIVISTIVGARLGHVFFYEWPRYKHNLFDIFKVWEGGLASHGGLIAILIGLYLFCKKEQKLFPELTFIDWTDLLMIPSAFVIFCIRMGNFFNQEIIGPATQVPWAIIFLHPIDGSAPVPRHPVQLYEAIVYLTIFFLLLVIWIKYRPLKRGILTGLFMVIVFGSRFFLEFFKIPSSLMIDESFLQTSQLLSIPPIIWGIWLLLSTSCKKKYLTRST